MRNGLLVAISLFVLTRAGLADVANPGIGILLSAGVAPSVVHVNGLRIPLAIGTPITARYEWNFDDPRGAFNTLPGFNAAHIYDRPGQYHITLTITDEAGHRQVATSTVTIVPKPSAADFCVADRV